MQGTKHDLPLTAHGWMMN